MASAAAEPLLDFGMVRLVNLGQSDVSGALPLPLLPLPPPPAGAEPRGGGADVAPAAVSQMVAMLHHADVSYMCARARTGRGCLAAACGALRRCAAPCGGARSVRCKP